MNDRRAQFIDNYDGDTVTMILDQGFHDMKEINIRLANVWAPEIRDPGGIEVQQFIEHWFKSRELGLSRWQFLVITHVTKQGNQIKTFERYAADVMSLDGKEHLNSDVMKFITDNKYSGGIGAP